MAAKPEKPPEFWAKVQADYCLGMSLAKLAEKYSISVRTIVHRAKLESWRRVKEPPNNKRPDTKQHAVVALKEAISTEDRVDAVHAAVAETLKDIMDDHRRITRGLRELFEDTVGEYRAMLSYLSSFLNQEVIDEFLAKGDQGGLEKYLRGAMSVFDVRTGTMDKLVRIGLALVDGERRVWGLDALEGEKKADDWDSLLEEMEKPVAIPALPAHVIDFERKLAASKTHRQ